MQHWCNCAISLVSWARLSCRERVWSNSYHHLVSNTPYIVQDLQWNMSQAYTRRTIDVWLSAGRCSLFGTFVRSAAVKIGLGWRVYILGFLSQTAGYKMTANWSEVSTSLPAWNIPKLRLAVALPYACRFSYTNAVIKSTSRTIWVGNSAIYITSLVPNWTLSQGKSGDTSWIMKVLKPYNC